MTTHEWVETIIPQHPQYLYPAINDLYDLSNTPTTMTPSISAITTLPSDISKHTSIFLDHDSDLSPSILQQLVIKW